MPGIATIISIVISAIKALIGLRDRFKKKQIEKAYEEADESKKGQAKAEAKTAGLEAEKQAELDRKKGVKDLTGEEDY